MSPPESDLPWVPLRHYLKLAQAREAALALSARDLPHRIDRRGEAWLLSVEPHAADAAEAELALAEAEQLASPTPEPDSRPALPFRPWSLLFGGAIMAGAFLLQGRAGEVMLERGAAESAAICARGQWWRCFTALLLHADLAHLLANLAFGLLFTGFLFAPFGAGIAWLLVVLAGGAGNAFNAWGYRGESHFSIGASTGVFAALGLLVGAELCARWALPATRTRRHLLAPLGGGLALLAFLGVGERHEQIDFMAHAWGFFAGMLLAIPVAMATLRRPPPSWLQPLAGLAALALLGLAWAFALGSWPR